MFDYFSSILELPPPARTGALAKSASNTSLKEKNRDFTVVEICAGGGGQALGLENAGFRHLACVEYEPEYCKTLQLNRPDWRIFCQDVKEFDGDAFAECDLLAGGIPCPPFSIAGKQLGKDDDRDLFPAMLRLVEEMAPRAVMVENVKGFLAAKFSEYREGVIAKLKSLGYLSQFRILESADYGVPQLRPRFILVAMRERDMKHFDWPKASPARVTVGEALYELMAQNGWPGAARLKKLADKVAPTLVGGSKKHGGPDLGPTRAKRQWKELGVDGLGIANDPPDAMFPPDALPRLTLKMAARVQGFPDDWRFYGTKTGAYRQIGNAFPPPVAEAVGREIINAFKKATDG